MVLVKGGYVVDPASGFEGVADILTEKGKKAASGIPVWKKIWKSSMRKEKS